jgi:hypothetical protein
MDHIPSPPPKGGTMNNRPEAKRQKQTNQSQRNAAIGSTFVALLAGR